MRTLLASAALLFAAVGPAQAAYLAEVTAPDGNTYPLPENLQPVHSQHLLELRWSEFPGARTRVAVNKVDNTSSVGSYTITDNDSTTDLSYAYQTVPVNGIEAMITDILNRTNRFRMVERQAIGNVLQEQDFGASGRVAQPSAAATGSVLGAQYLVEAVITNYEAGVSGSNMGAIGGLVGGRAGGLLGGLGVSSSKAAFGMNIRLIDATTSEVIFTKQINREVSKSGLTFGGLGVGGGGGLGGFVSSYTKTPIGQTVLASINEAAYELIKRIGVQAATGSVVKAQGPEVFLNLGEGQVQVGDTLTLLRKGEALIDPETGISLGSDDTEIGSVQVRDVKEKYSIASPIGSVSGGIRPGDKVVSRNLPEPMEFAPLDSALTKEPRKGRR